MKILLTPFLIVAFNLLTVLNIAAQEISLTEPDANDVSIGKLLVSRDIDDILLDYDVILGGSVRSCYVSLYASIDAGENFHKITDSLYGDWGNIDKTGHKKISIPLNIYEHKFAGRQMAFELRVESKDVVAIENTHIDEAEDLSMISSANCYIISKEGLYSFRPVKGNSSRSVGEVASVDVIWESFGTLSVPEVGALISETYLQSGKIYFRTSSIFKKGNAVIAAKDSSGDILWSWHIWLTDELGEQIYWGDGGIVMDRNLGAISSELGNCGASGLLYQWGRKDPFPGMYGVNVGAVKSNGEFTSVSFSAKIGTVDYAICHPTTFISGDSVNGDWNSRKEDGLWSSQKTIYDPCPSGWRVAGEERTGSTDNIWITASGLSTEFSSTYDSENKGINFYGVFGGDGVIWYPATGFITSKGDLISTNSGGVWTVTPSGKGAISLYYSAKGVVNPFRLSRRSLGQAVRCIKEL